MATPTPQERQQPQLLSFNLKMLRWLNLWHDDDDDDVGGNRYLGKQLRDYALLIPILPAYSFIFWDLYNQMTGIV